ncbi:hypothetical protein [Nocardia barduliensis]|uniref:hypothetical protein n=1 Tax=Nocardia barduliensis TaxID=2736643 RepID=UPI00157344BE|nr:hypothetical protein [Nocardia barduliensis]
MDTAVGNAARAVAGRLTATGAHLRGTAVRLEHADAEGTVPFAHSDIPPSARRMVGADLRSGRAIRFQADDVVSIPLTDSRGNVIGVSFPSRKGDAESKKLWARAKLRSSDHVHYAFWKKDPAAKKPEWVFGQRRTAPWADTDPVYAHAHADSDTFHISVRTGRWGSKPVQIDGATYAELLAANHHLAQALHTRPGPLVLLSCSPARPGGSAAASMSGHLHSRTTIDRDVYAATGDVMTRLWPSQEDISMVGVEVDPKAGDAADSLWEVHRAPRGTPTVPDGG